MHILELNDVASGYGKKRILEHVNFRTEKSGIYVVLGTNGSGKTTLFRTIAGVIEPFSGNVQLDGQSIISSKARNGEKRRRMNTNYLSHNNAIPEEMTVYNALDFWSSISGLHGEEEGSTTAATEKVISLLDLGDLAEKKFSDLSEGQKKRVSIATIFLNESDLYLLDEPTASLDPVFSKQIRDIILDLGRDRIVLYSSHNLYEATDIGTHLLLVRNGTVEYFDDISSIRSSYYRVGIKASADITKFVDAKPGEGGYYVLTLSDREDAGNLLKMLVENGVQVYEMRALDNPLQELFEDNSRRR
ncbi:MAG TPA: ABC transporter ATP-binding protein [Nitrososphaera sp.]|nr:ABC transporter ATP-binding protein [Nitrososphaera sp.]